MELSELSSYCESPIEVRLAEAIAATFADFETANIRISVAEPREYASLWPLPDGMPACIIPQAQIDMGDTCYRVDFLLICGPRPIFRRLFAIECDGHEWHEKSKDQVARDKHRERRLLAEQGIATVRFAGSEIFADAQACAEFIRSLAHGATGDALHDAHLRGSGTGKAPGE